MLVDVAQTFPMFDLPLPVHAFADLEEETPCAVCGSTPLPPRASQGATLQWLQRHDLDAATRMLAAIEYRGEPDDFAGRSFREKQPPDWHEFRSRAVNDSRLTIALPVPDDMLELLVAQFDEALEQFVPDAFSVPVCQRCLVATWEDDRIVPMLIETYVHLHFDGNLAAARAQPAWPLAERFTALIDVIVVRNRRTG